MIYIDENACIYILCPANNKTGGTELLHQLCDELNNNNFKAYMAYYFEGTNRTQTTPEAFKKYNIKECIYSSIEDNEENIIILPEIAIGMQKHFKKIRKCIWWLSVDNFVETVGFKNRFKKYGILSLLKHIVDNDISTYKDINSINYHLCQSYYAIDFLKSLGITSNVYYLSDYINDIYMRPFKIHDRKDIVLYNPKKGFDFTEKLIHFSNAITWKPIINMSNEEVLNTLRESKVYVDFGNHPGKDRIPREAAISGCCVITGMNGSARFWEDVPIPQEYKYKKKEENVSAIISKILFCLNNYEDAINDFKQYREYIKSEKKNFTIDLLKIFVR